MSAADLLRQGQRFMARQFPAVIKYDGQCYSENVSSNGIQRGFDLGMGEGHPSRRISFWVPIEVFRNANKPIPSENTVLFSRPLEAPASDQWIEYNLENVSIDAAGINLTLACVAQPS